MSDERPRLPVEPLSERRWQEIRRGVLARAADDAAAAPAPERARRPPRAAWGAAIAIAAVALFWWSAAGEPSAPSTSRVVTDAETIVASAGDATLELGPHTSVLVVRVGDDQWLVSLEHGSVRCAVPTRGSRPPFAVEAGRTRVVVVGTAFTVTRAPGADTASVEVDHGTVRVSDPSGEHVLHDADRWPVPTVAMADVPTAAVPAPVAIADEAPRSDADDPVAPRGGLEVPHAARPHPSDAPSRPSTPATAQSSEATSRPTPRARYQAAESLEASDPAAAIAAYDALVHEGGPYAAPALVAACRVELEQHHTERARALCERYLAEHAGGINAEDARALLARMR